MTRLERTNQRSLDFSHWIRKNLKDSFRGLIAQDIDWILLNYCTGYFILLEEKTNRPVSDLSTSPAQTVMLKMLDEMLSKATEFNITRPFSINPATKIKYQYKGCFILEFLDGTDPENARQICLNGKAISKNDLINLLNLDSAKSIDLINRYRCNWIDENLRNQISRLNANCSSFEFEVR